MDKLSNGMRDFDVEFRLEAVALQHIELGLA